MNHWPFIVAAYVLTAIGAFGLTAWSMFAMRRAEKKVDEL
jgi:hypothetical protein